MDLRIKVNVCKIMSIKYILRQWEVAVHLNLLISPSKNSGARQVETRNASEEDEFAIYYYFHLLFGHGRHFVTWRVCNTGPNPYWIAGMERQQNLCADTSPL